MYPESDDKPAPTSAQRKAGSLTAKLFTVSASETETITIRKKMPISQRNDRNNENIFVLVYCDFLNFILQG